MIKLGLIGYGYWGPNVARNAHKNSNIKLLVICDKKSDRLDKAKEIFLDQTKYEKNAEKVINNPEIDAIALAVETSSHFELAKRALLAGKDVYIEKPITSTVEEAEELKEIAEENNLIIHVDHIMIYHPVIKMIKKLYESGELGDLMYFDIARMNLGQIKMDVSAMWDLAVHDLSIIDDLTGGLEETFVSAIGEKKFSITETLTFLTIRYQNIIAHIKSSWISPLKERKLIVAGTKKMVVFDDLKADGKLMIYDKGIDIIHGDTPEYNDYVVKIRTGDILIPQIPIEDALFNSIDHFINCIKTRKQSKSGPEQAIRIIKILTKADKQMNSGAKDETPDCK